MAVSDPIADMLTRIRNGAKARFNSVDVPGSKLKTVMALNASANPAVAFM
jgi:small subunit ribosomal protein S8